MQFSIYVALLLSVNASLRERPPTTTTTAPPKEADYCRAPSDARWRVVTDQPLPDDCSGLIQRKRFAVECAKQVNDATVQYLRTMEFDFCQAHAWYAVPVDPVVGSNESFWSGVTEAWMTFPIVNTKGTFKASSLQLYGATESQGGTSCQIGTNDIDKALAGGLIDAEVTEISESEITVDLMTFLADSYLGLDHTVILVTANQAAEDLPPKLIGEWKGLLAVVRPEECKALQMLVAPLTILYFLH